MSPDYPNFRDLYELQQNTDEKLEKVNDRLSRMEKAVIVLMALSIAPRLSGLDLTQLATAVFHAF